MNNPVCCICKMEISTNAPYGAECAHIAGEGVAHARCAKIGKMWPTEVEMTKEQFVKEYLELGRKQPYWRYDQNTFGHVKTNRPDWDTYFMSLCYLMATRSLDARTKHASLAVDSEHSILAVGYNSPPRDCVDEEIPNYDDRKYPFFVHSEQNLIANAARNGIPLKGSTLYVSGEPCHICLRSIINVGFKEVVCGLRWKHRSRGVGKTNEKSKIGSSKVSGLR